MTLALTAARYQIVSERRIVDSAEIKSGKITGDVTIRERTATKNERMSK